MLPASAGLVTSTAVQRAAGTAAGKSGRTASTVTRKLSDAEPPELLAVTVTRAPSTGVAVGIETRPVAGSTVAPAPDTEKTQRPRRRRRRPPPQSARAAPRGEAPGRRAGPTTRGAGQVTASGAVSAAAWPAALVAVTRAARSVRSSPGPGV